MNNKKYIKLIYDEVELKNFFDTVVQPLKRDEVYFVSLSARNKYILEEDRKKVGLSRTEMFARTIIRQDNFDYFLRKLKRLECSEDGYTTKTNQPIPEYSMVVYYNINPSSMVKAYNKLVTEFNNQMVEFFSSEHADHQTKYDYFTRIDLKLLKFIQNTRGTKHYLDVDFDINKETEIEVLYEYLTFLKEHAIEYCVIETNGGFHVLIKRNTITCNFQAPLKDLDSKVKKEVVLNSNEMIPLPGTICGGFKVKLRLDL